VKKIFSDKSPFFFYVSKHNKIPLGGGELGGGFNSPGPPPQAPDYAPA